MSRGRILLGIAALVLIGALPLGAFIGLGWEAFIERSRMAIMLDSYLLMIIRFTLWQALLSTLLSVVPALFVARALLHHPSFPGRSLILQLFAIPIVLPAIVAALGVLSLYGRSGIIAPLATDLSGVQWPGVYGLSGILIAHVFFNLPLATRLFLYALETIPSHQWRLADLLGMGAGSGFRFIEWPVLRAALPGIAGLVFMLCVTSFTVVLTLGGGPAATTLEVAIYQSLRFDFDPARAMVFTLAQLILTGSILMLLKALGASLIGDANLSVSWGRKSFIHPMERIINGFILVLAVCFVGGPILATLVSGLASDLSRLIFDPEVHQATLLSLRLAALASALCLVMTFGLVAARREMEFRRKSAKPGLFEWLTETGATGVLVVPPFVIGAGWFILLRFFGDVFSFAQLMVIAVNSIMAVPFTIRFIRPAYDSTSIRYEKLCAVLGISGWARIRMLDWPTLRRPAATAFAFAMALSLGDLGVIALFGSDQVQTLPYLLLQRMSSYRTTDAAGIALLLGLLCFVLMLIANRFEGKRVG